MRRIIITCGIYYITKENKLLIAHPTGHGKDFWTIPKGKREYKESYIDAAIRETKEETNITLPRENLNRLVNSTYKTNRKKLISYVIFEKDTDLDHKEFDLRCNTFVGKDAKWNQGKPEVDAYKFITIKEAYSLIHESQRKPLRQIEEILNK